MLSALWPALARGYRPVAAACITWLSGLAVTLATFDPVADGEVSWLLRSMTIGLVAGAAAALVPLFACGCALRPPRASTGAGHRHEIAHLAAALLFLACALLPAAVHAVRRPHPVRDGRSFWVISDRFGGVAAAEARWQALVDGSASITNEQGRLVLANDPGSRAVLEATFLARNPSRFAALQPAGLAALPYAERLEWRASAQRASAFYMVLEAWSAGSPLWLQLTAYGLHVTYADASGRRMGQEITETGPLDASERHWALSRGKADVALALNGRTIWRAPSLGPFTRISFGEVVSDAQHGGRLALSHVYYDRRVEAGT